jgi:chaperone modulatory protein CbpM
MVKHEIMIIADYTQQPFFTMKELCEICNISSDILNELIEYEIIRPNHGTLTFTLTELTRAKTALRLRHDLDLNFQGIILVLELLEELKTLREQTKLLEKQFLK